jgi:hypothetical protein
VLHAPHSALRGDCLPEGRELGAVCTAGWRKAVRQDLFRPSFSGPPELPAAGRLRLRQL